MSSFVVVCLIVKDVKLEWGLTEDAWLLYVFMCTCGSVAKHF
jgi:hypothetical protein